MTIPAISIEIPAVPSRSTQSEEQFVLATDNFFTVFPVLREQMNASIAAINAAVVSITTIGEAASAAADRAEAASGFRVSVAAASWAALSAIAGSYAGQTAAVYGDEGTHTDPVASGTVDNAGIYAWSVSPAGWEWLDDGGASSVAWGDITGKPSSFTPATHTHIISDVTGLQDALDAKVAISALSESVRDAIGTALVAGDGVTITVDDEGDTITIAAEGGGGEMVYPGAGIAVSTGSGWGSSLSAPSGSLVGTSGSQTLTSKTLGSGTTISGGTITAGPSVSDSGTIAADSVGFRGLPRITGSSRTLTANDHGKLISLTGNFTLPNGLPIGFSAVLYNNSSSASTVSASGTLRQAGTASTGSVSLAQRGLASVVVVGSNEWVISGPVS